MLTVKYSEYVLLGDNLLKKIVFVLGNYKNGGMAMRATNLANEFAMQGHLVDIVVTGEKGAKPFIRIADNVRVMALDDYNQCVSRSNTETNNRNARINKLKRVGYFTKWIPSIDNKLKNRINFLRAGEKMRHYFVHHPHSTVIAFGASYIKDVLSATEGLDCKVIYAEKTAPGLEISHLYSDFELYINLLRQTKAVIVQTHAAKDYYSKYLSNVFVINNPINPGLPGEKVGFRKKKIVNFCRISREKNLELLLLAFEKIHREYQDYIVEIYGNIVSPDEQLYKEELLEEVKVRKMSEFFRILPPVADVHKKVIDAEMFVSTSDYEGLSNSMLEAMAIGLPCICTDCLGGGTTEVMVDHENGLIVPRKDADALYCAMKEYIEHPELAEKCSRNAVAIKEKLDVKRIATQWLEIIENEEKFFD